MDTVKSKYSIETIPMLNSKLKLGVWLVRRKLIEREMDGVSYTMDYGIETVVHEIRFDKPKRVNSKEVKEASRQIGNLYPHAAGLEFNTTIGGK